MPRFNVQNPQTKQWRCFSTVCDDFVSDWMDEPEYEEWRQIQYGVHCGPVREANQMTLEEAQEIIRQRIEWEKEDADN